MTEGDGFKMDTVEHIELIRLKHQDWLAGTGDPHENIVFLLNSIEFLLLQCSSNKELQRLRDGVKTIASVSLDRPYPMDIYRIALDMKKTAEILLEGGDDCGS